MRLTWMEVYRRLEEAFGPQRWWPGETPFEVMAGAILTQNTSWKNVEKAIARLKEEGALTPRRDPRVVRGRAGGAHPVVGLLPRQGPAAQSLCRLPFRSVRRRFPRNEERGPGGAQAEAAQGRRDRTGDGGTASSSTAWESPLSSSTRTRSGSWHGTGGSRRNRLRTERSRRSLQPIFRLTRGFSTSTTPSSSGSPRSIAGKKPECCRCPLRTL